jgi:hypothetical protein
MINFAENRIYKISHLGKQLPGQYQLQTPPTSNVLTFVGGPENVHIQRRHLDYYSFTWVHGVNTLADAFAAKYADKYRFDLDSFKYSVGPGAFARNGRDTLVQYSLNFVDGSRVSVIMNRYKRDGLSRTYAKHSIDTIGGEGYRVAL